MPTYEYTVGGPVLRDRLWFFHGRATADAERSTASSSAPTSLTSSTDKSSALRRQSSPMRSTRITDSRARIRRSIATSQTTRSAPTLRWISRSLEDRSLPEDLFTINYTGVHHAEVLRRRTLFAAQPHVRRQRLEVHGPSEGHAAGHPGRQRYQCRHVLRCLHGRTARQSGYLRQVVILPLDERKRIAQP